MGAKFVVQCQKCYHWRIVPCKEKYEEIREHLNEQPFICDGQGKEWKPDMSCEDPSDIEHDGSRVWVRDRPNIPRPPLGWDRRVRLRVEWRSSKIADVYYYAPWGKMFRSKAEIRRYLDENPQHREGVNLAKFSFKIPMPFQQQDSTAAAVNPASDEEEIQESAEPIEEACIAEGLEKANGSKGSDDEEDPTWPESVSTLPPKKRKFY